MFYSAQQSSQVGVASLLGLIEAEAEITSSETSAAVCCSNFVTFQTTSILGPSFTFIFGHNVLFFTNILFIRNFVTEF